MCRQIDVQTDGLKDRWMTDIWMYGQMVVLADEYTDRWIDRQMDAKTDGLTDEKTYRCTN
jgi:hypothetical protein